jgi:hypothetical protein
MMTRCPYLTLEVAAELYGIQDIESLIVQMMAIEEFINGNRKR